MVLAAADNGNFVNFMCIGLGAWIAWRAYMATFRTDEWMKIRRQEEEASAKRHEQMARAAGGALKGAFFIANLFRK